MGSRFSQVIIIVPLLITVVACEVASPPVSAQPTASPVATLSVDSPQPELGTKPQRETLVPGSPAAPTAQPNDAKQIVALLDEMETAVLAQNRDLYLSYVDLSDPIFALEHTRWADGWSQQNLVTHFDLALDHLVIEGDEATADLTMIWTIATADNPSSQEADFPVRFQKSKDGAWRYAGEAWLTFETEHFRVRAMPGLIGVAKEISTKLPEIYDYVTSNFGHTPSSNLEIKLYDTSAVLVANTLLSLPEIHGWNEPGESLKLVAAADEAPPLAALAHEFTHFLTFDMAGTARPRMPWWLSEGIAMEIGSHYWTVSEQNERLDQVREWATEGRLIEWDRISNFETTPVELWRYVHPQGYAFVRYVTETFGIEKRNAWLHAMTVEMDLPEATQTKLNMSFDELNADFLAWLEAPLTNTGDLTPTARAMAPFDPASFRMGLEQVANGFERPVYVTDAGDGSNRLFVVEQAGRIRVIDINGQVLDSLFLDIHERVSSGGERGLLSVAFHPNYETNGFFYVDYTDLNGDTVVARYNVSKNDLNRADPESELMILAVDQPAANHNGGLLLFGPDGYLYIGLGDGGGGRSENGQRQDTLLGKILRIDVNQTSGSQPYAVPPDNPFVQNPDVRPEIWAYGLRNPWRFSFDRATGDLYIGDVGAATYEEINFQPADSQGGENYGWNLMEGTECRQAKGSCNASDLVSPIAEYKHSSGGCVVTGGYVYRGQAVPTLTGTYLFADYCSGRVWGLGRNLAGAWVMSNPVETELRISSFGEDEAGGLYLVDIGGAVYRIVTSQP